MCLNKNPSTIVSSSAALLTKSKALWLGCTTYLCNCVLTLECLYSEDESQVSKITFGTKHDLENKWWQSWNKRTWCQFKSAQQMKENMQENLPWLLSLLLDDACYSGCDYCDQRNTPRLHTPKVMKVIKPASTRCKDAPNPLKKLAGALVILALSKWTKCWLEWLGLCQHRPSINENPQIP